MVQKTLRVTSGRLAAKQVEEWLALANGTPNLVGGSEDRDKRTLQHVHDCVRHHLRATQRSRSNANRILAILNQGRSGASMPAGVTVHVPELRRAVASLIPRMVEAVIGAPQYFQVVGGRDGEDATRAKGLRKWAHYQIDQSELAHRLGPCAMSLLVHGFAMLATGYCFETQQTRRRVAERGKDAQGEPITTYTIEEVEEVVSEGSTVEFVDGFDAILDYAVSDPKDMRWIGRRKFVSDVAALEMIVAADWHAANTREALAKSADADRQIPGFAGMGLQSMQRRASSLLQQTETRKAGGAGLHELVELEGLFDLHGSGEYVETQIAILNNTVVLCREQPRWSKKRRSFKFVALSDDGTELVGVTPTVFCVALQAEIDQLRACALRGVMSAAAPFSFSRGANLTLPNSLWDCAPGRHFNLGVDPTASIDTIKMPSSAGELLGMERQIRSDIEEAMGAPRFWTGADTTGTATEIERRNEEARRTLLNKAQKLEDLVHQCLDDFFMLSRMYTTESHRYAVMGAEAGMLEWDEVSPESFSDPVNFIMLGTATIDVYGMRATKIMGMMQAVTPTLLQLYATGEVKPRDVAKMLMDTMAGPHVTREVLPPDESELAMDPEDENSVLAAGQQVPVRSIDDHDEHLVTHAPLERHSNPRVREVTAVHRALHIQAKAKAAAQQQQQARRISMQNPGQEDGTDGRLRPQEGRSGRSGQAYTRPPDMLSDSSTGTPSGETPGPPATARMASPDRSPAVPQVGNR